MTHLALAAAVLVSTLASSLWAQVRIVRHGEDRLVGITEVDVLVTSTAAMAACDVNAADAQQQALRALREGGLKATASHKARSSHYSVVVEIQTSAVADSCSSSLLSELVAEVAGIPEADNSAAPGAWGSLLIGAMPLARESALVISARVAHDATVQQAIARQVRALAARVRSANR